MTNFTLRCLKYFAFFILAKIMETILFFALTFSFGDALIGNHNPYGYLITVAVITGGLYIVLGFCLSKDGVLSKAIIMISLGANVIIYIGTLVWLDGNLLAEEQGYKHILFSIYTAGYAFSGLVSHWLEKVSFLSVMLRDVIVSILTILYTHFAIAIGNLIFIKCKGSN